MTQLFKPVMQTQLHNPPESYGNCFWACVSSITGIPLDEFPVGNVYTEERPWALWAHEIFEKHGFELNGCSDDFTMLDTYEGIGGYFVVGGQSSRPSDAGHAVVYCRGQFVHDPHPDQEDLVELVELEEIYLIERVGLE